MYSQISSDFLDSKTSDISDQVVKNPDDREKFLDGILSEYLNTEKLREKHSLREKLKYRHHQLEIAAKQMRKDEKKKRDAEALLIGQTSSIQTSHYKKFSLNLKTRKSLKMYRINKSEDLDYKKYQTINKLWCSYASSCLVSCFGSPANKILHEENVLNCLKQMDYHGCHLTVKKSSSKYLIGIRGLVLQDKKNALYLLTEENKVKIVPKVGSLFEFELLGFCKMTLVGSNMCYRPEMRSTKHAKIKTKNVK